MVQQRACAIGVDQVMSVYDDIREKYPFFSIWYNKSDKFIQSLADDPEQTREFLLTSLAVLENSGDNAMYYLKIHPKFSEIYTRTGMEVCSIPFRLNPYEAGTGVAVNGIPTDAGYRSLREELADLKKELLELRAEDEAEPAPKDMLSQIAGLMDHPQIGPAIGALLTPIATKIAEFIGGALQTAAPQQNAMLANPQISGINESDTMTEEEINEKLNKALDRLEPVCDLANDLTLLANMAEKNPPMFNMMLATLRAQK